jgi:hypothetical protein
MKNMSRDQIIDYYRGLVIIDMMLIHYSYCFPKVISKIINYHDIAIEGFILLSGFAIGKYYLPLYLKDRNETVILIIKRIFKIIIVQYILIVTISLPHYILLNGTNGAFNFLLESIIFYNQIGLMHILPTFLPLFLVSPVILYLLSRNYDVILILSSVLLFIIGQKNPYLMNYGSKAIFPVILWQIYFVIGCYLGKRISQKERKTQFNNINKLLVVSFLFLIVALTFKHSASLSIWITDFKTSYDIRIQKFPLNVYGLLFGICLINFIVIYSLKYWYVIKGNFATNIISDFGRNSLLVFAVHVYFLLILDIMRIRFQIDSKVILILFALNIVSAFYLIRYSNGENSGKVLRFLFR